MSSYLSPKISSFFVANFRNSQLLRVICTSNLNILDRRPLRSDTLGGFLIIPLHQILCISGTDFNKILCNTLMLYNVRTENFL